MTDISKTKAELIEKIKTITNEQCICLMVMLAANTGVRIPLPQLSRESYEQVLTILKGITVDNEVFTADTIDKAIELVKSQMEGIA